MKKLYSICLLIILAVSGCTQNNGYIGPIFGSWSLMEISADGEPLAMTGETVFSFQNEVVRIEDVSNFPNKGVIRFGNFSIIDDVLSLKFLTELSPSGEGNSYMMPTWLYFPEGEMPLKFDIKKLKGSNMVLVLTDGERDLTYSFKKTW